MGIFMFSRCVSKIVVFIIKFEPMEEFNFKKLICFSDYYNIVIILTNVD
jgi:hypothetical protein